MKYILGIDIGTTNTKAVAYDFHGKVLGLSNRTYPFISPQEGYHELDPDVLLNSVVEVMTEIIPSIKGTLSGVCFSAAMHGLIAVDTQCRPLTNMITWADLRSSAYAAQLKASPVAKRLYERTGTPIHPMSPLCKLMWMKENLPGVFLASHKFISIKEYAFFHFFGEFVIDRSVASSTGLLDIYSLDWNPDALEAAGITPAKLSRHVASDHIITGLASMYAQQFGVDPQTPFIAGASDGCLAHIGSNALAKKDISLTIGTSGAVRIMTDRPLFDPKERLFNYLLTDHIYLSGGPVNNGGNVLQWFAKGFLKKDFTTAEDFEAFIDEAFSVPAGSEGLIFLPYIYGERAPVWDADARGVFYGVSAVHTMAHFMRAVMEGVSFALFDILNSVTDVAGDINHVYASGGFIRSRKWLGMLADVLGRKILVTHAEDSSAAGAAILGMTALGILGNIRDAQSFFSIKDTFEPDPEAHSLYLKNYSVYAVLYEKLKDIKR